MISNNKIKIFWEKSIRKTNCRFLLALEFYKTLVFIKSGKKKKKKSLIGSMKPSLKKTVLTGNPDQNKRIKLLVENSKWLSL